jgi:hypothetical protein
LVLLIRYACLYLYLWRRGADSCFSQYHEFPIIMTNIDLTFEKGVHEEAWPPYPWIAAVMFRWLYVPKNKGAWRFSCCDTYGYPKDLPFV